MDEDDNLNPTANSSSSVNPSFLEQHANPYFLHHSDNTSIVLVSELLTDENYTSWSRSMVIALTVKNKIGFIDGSIPRPTGDLLNLWIICNSVVISWILNSLSKEISASVLFSDSARAIWLDLKERFQRQNRPRIFQLRRELMNLIQDQLSVSAYFTRLKTIWTELASYRSSCSCNRCSCGGIKELEDHYQQEYVMNFLMGLNDSYSQIRAQLLLMEPAPTINRAFALVAQETQQRAISAPPVVSPAALAVRSQLTSRTHSYSSQPKKREKSLCTHCGLHGHTVDKCYKLHGYPPGYRSNYNRLPSSENSSKSSKSAETN